MVESKPNHVIQHCIERTINSEMGTGPQDPGTGRTGRASARWMGWASAAACSEVQPDKEKAACAYHLPSELCSTYRLARRGLHCVTLSSVRVFGKDGESRHRKVWSGKLSECCKSNSGSIRMGSK
jgi:hypothetical protein